MVHRALRAATLVVVSAIALAIAPTANADNVVADDQIVQGSICGGPDCVNNESFGFDTLRLKGTTLRLAFNDTSVGAFPSNDWALVANDADGVGPDSYFGFQDVTADTIPFRIAAGAPTGTLTVRGDGSVLLGTGALLQRVDGTTTSAAAAIDPDALLTALRALPVGTYQFTADAANLRHLGPMASDFNAAFALGTGTSESSIADQAGVALAATKELAARVADLQGARGAKGETGPTGPAGANGRDGANGTGVSQATLTTALDRLDALEAGQVALRKRNTALAATIRKLERQLRDARRAAAKRAH